MSNNPANPATTTVLPDSHEATADQQKTAGQTVALESERLESASDALIVALDFPDRDPALALADQLRGTCRWVKVGLELFVAAGPSIVTVLADRGFSVFLDLKLHDIPNTVAAAARSAALLGARLLTVHAAGGPAMLAAAQEALTTIPNPPRLLAVTVLTSMDEAELAATGVHRSASGQVELLAAMSLAAGIRGFVCSAREVARLRALAGPAGVLVTPGIRPVGAASGDQRRIATPAQALRDGASFLVVGRPITQAANPAEAASAILREMSASRSE